MSHNPDCFLCQKHQATGLPRWHLHHFTAAMDAALIAASRRGYAAVRELRQTDPQFRQLPYYVVRRRGAQIGVPRGAFSNDWHPEEDAVFAEHISRQYTLEKWQRLLKHKGFHRSLQAIRSRMVHEGWSTRQGEWSLGEIAHGFGVTQQTVARWADRGWLKATHVSDGTQRVRYASTHEIRRMLMLYPELAVKGKPDVLWLVSLLIQQRAGRTYEAPDEGPDESGDWMNGDPTNTTALVLTRRKVMV